MQLYSKYFLVSVNSADVYELSEDTRSAEREASLEQGRISLCPIGSKSQFCLVLRQNKIQISIRSDIVKCSPGAIL